MPDPASTCACAGPTRSPLPDLLTHGCVALLIEWGLAPRRRAVLAPVFVAGSLLPDILCRVPGIVAGEIDTKLHPLPPLLIYGWEPLHQPLGGALAALALAMLFPPAWRLRVFTRLFLGMLLHIGMDMLQFHEGAGQMLFFPFWPRAFELGWIGSEDSVLLAGPLVLVTLLLGWWRRRRLEKR